MGQPEQTWTAIWSQVAARQVERALRAADEVVRPCGWRGRRPDCAPGRRKESEMASQISVGRVQFQVPAHDGCVPTDPSEPLDGGACGCDCDCGCECKGPDSPQPTEVSETSSVRHGTPK